MTQHAANAIFAQRLEQMLDGGDAGDIVDGEARSSLANPEPWLAEFFNGGGPARAGVTVTADTALSASSVFACVRNISEDMAKLPLIVYRRLAGGGKDRLPGDRLHYLLHDEPNPEMTALDFRQAITACAVLLGNGYAEIERANDGTPLYLWPIEHYRVVVKRGPDKRIYYEIDGGRARIGMADMLHLKGFGTNGVLGHMLLHAGRESIGLTIAAERFAASFFGNGTQLSGVLEYPKVLTEEALKTLRQQWMETHSGPDNAHKPAILENGMTWKKTSTEPNEAQLVESRQFQVEDVARWFRMPPHKIGHLLRATGWSTLETTNSDYVIDTLMPWAVRWEQEAKRKLVSKNEPAIFAEHLFNGLMRGESAARAQFYTALRNLGILNADEIREFENLDPLPDGQGQVYLVPMNMVDARVAAQNGAAAAAGSDLEDPPAAPLPPGPGNDEPNPLTNSIYQRMLTAHRPSFLDAAGRVVRREVQVLRKQGRSAESIAKFFAEHADYVRSSFRPALLAWEGARAAIGNREVAAVDASIDFAPFIRELTEAVAAGKTDQVLDRWEKEKADELVKHFLKAEVAS